MITWKTVSQLVIHGEVEWTEHAPHSLRHVHLLVAGHGARLPVHLHT